MTGPPSTIWRKNVGTTLPRLPSTLPKRTAAKGSAYSLPIESTASSATRLLAPMIEHGSTALSVEMCTRRQRWSAATCAERPRAEHVGLHGFGRVRLEDRNVLVRGGVEHDVGLVAFEDLAQPALVADVGEDRLGLVERRHDLEEEAVVAVEQEQAGGAVLRDLAGDLAADRTAGAGDENDRAFEVVGDVARVGGRVLAAEEVGEVEVAEVVEQRLAARVGGPGEHLHLRVGACSARASISLRRSRDASGSAITTRSMRSLTANVFEVVGRAEHAQRAHRTADELRVVVDEADDDGVAEACGLRARAPTRRRHRSRRRSACADVCSCRRADARARTGELGIGCRRSRGE